MTEPHNLIVSHVPYDGPGIRIVGSIQGGDVHIGELREILDSTEEDLARTGAALGEPALRELAIAVRAALLNNQKLAFHLLEIHRAIADGTINYPEDPITAYDPA
jgi:hypothetical protein